MPAVKFPIPSVTFRQNSLSAEIKWLSFFLDTWSFTVFFRSSQKDVIETVLHECSHFLFFKKWHEVYPKTPRRHFDAPYLVWRFSELSAPVILNDPRMQKVNARR